MVDIQTESVYQQTGWFEDWAVQANGKTNGGVGRRKMRPMQAVLKEGLEAALRADPEVLEHCKPKTGAGLIVRALVLEAGKGKVTAIRQVMSLLDREDEAAESEEYKGTFDEPRWDWDPQGAWQTLPEPKADEAEAGDHPARIELKRRLKLLMQGNDDDRARAARIIQKMRESIADDFAREIGLAA